MGIRFACPSGHNLNVKEHLAGKRGICPICGAKVVIPAEPLKTTTGTASSDSSNSPPTIAAPEGDSPPAEPIAPLTPQLSAPPDENAVPIPPVVTPPEVAPIVVPPRETSVPAIAPPVEILARQEGQPTSIPIEAAPVAQYVAHRRRSKRAQRSIAIALFCIVIVLALILVWVLNRDPQSVQPPAEASRIDSSVRPHYGAIESVDSIRSHVT